MPDGFAPIDRTPCARCSGPVVMTSRDRGTCSSCAKDHRFVRPQPGPQTHALECDADVMLYGGGAGGGKSVAMLLGAQERAMTYSGWVGAIFRSKREDIKGDDSGLWFEAQKLFRGTGAVFRGGNMMDVRWRGGASKGGGTLLFRHLAEANFESYRGKSYAFVAIDEANEVNVEWIMFLYGRVRTTCGAHPVMWLTCNPDPDHALASWVAPYLHQELDHPLYGCPDRELSGAHRWMMRSTKTDRVVFGQSRERVGELAGQDPDLAKKFVFIPSLLDDNPALDKADPNYRGNIAMQTGVRRAQLGRGSWTARADSGGMLGRKRWGAMLSAPLSPLVRWVRAWDRAATKPSDASPDPDFTACVLLVWDTEGRWYVADVDVCRKDGPDRDRWIHAIAKADGARVVQVCKQAPGDDGKIGAAHAAKLLAVAGADVRVLRESKDKATRCEPMALELERGLVNGKPPPADLDFVLGPGDIYTERGYLLDETGWFDRPYNDGGPAAETLGRLFWAQVDDFPAVQHDDIPDAMADAHAVGTVSGGRRRVSPAKRGRYLL